MRILRHARRAPPASARWGAGWGAAWGEERGAAGRDGAYRRKHVGHAAVGPRTDLGVGLIRQYLQPDRIDATAQQDQGCIVVELVQGVGVHLGAEDAHAGRVLRLGPFSGFLRDRQNARTPLSVLRATGRVGGGVVGSGRGGARRRPLLAEWRANPRR
eukprot:scaffold107693_cov56-Phaeocystis_antarctica.AAC.5